MDVVRPHWAGAVQEALRGGFQTVNLGLLATSAPAVSTRDGASGGRRRALVEVVLTPFTDGGRGSATLAMAIGFFVPLALFGKPLRGKSPSQAPRLRWAPPWGRSADDAVAEVGYAVALDDGDGAFEGYRGVLQVVQ